jgi:hypothetical protein
MHSQTAGRGREILAHAQLLSVHGHADGAGHVVVVVCVWRGGHKVIEGSDDSTAWALPMTTGVPTSVTLRLCSCQLHFISHAWSSHALRGCGAPC